MPAPDARTPTQILSISSAEADARAARQGMFAALAAFVTWGLAPLYFRALGSVPPFEIVAHRVLWSALFLAGLLAAVSSTGGYARVRAALAQPRLLALLTLAGLSGPVVFFGLTVFMGLGNGICLPNANAGMLSVRPELAGTASGLGGAILIGGGAALAAFAGVLLGPGSTEMPLILLMLASSIASVVAILLVIRRARQIGVA